MKSWPLLVLDFDGVICDSVDECFVSSWLAYHTLFRKNPFPRVGPLVRGAFTRLRPFIRSGEDYLLIQETLESGRDIPDQAAFDALIREAGPEKMARFKALMAQARTQLLAKQRAYWLSLNRIYPHVLAAFAFIPREAPVRILSTKAPELIKEILDHAHIPIAAAHIIRSQTEKKLPAVEEMRVLADRSRALFVDDQIDYLLEAGYPHIESYLASWGYVKQEWLSGALPVRVLTAEAFVEIVRRQYLDG